MKLKIKHTTETEVEINLPYYTKTLLDSGDIFCVAKVINDEQCVHVTHNDKVQLAAASLAVYDPKHKECTKQEFLDELDATMKFLQDKIYSA